MAPSTKRHRGPVDENEIFQGGDRTRPYFLSQCFFAICLLCVLGCSTAEDEEETLGKGPKDVHTDAAGGLYPVGYAAKNDDPSFIEYDPNKVYPAPNVTMRALNRLPIPYVNGSSGEEFSIESDRGECYYNRNTESICWRVYTCDNPSCDERGRIKFTREDSRVTVAKGWVVYPSSSDSDPTFMVAKCPKCSSTKSTEYFSPEVAQRKRQLEHDLKAVRWQRARTNDR